jgi:putative ABC transport system substrate-binding protein
VNRRTFLAGTGAVLLSAPLAAEAQQVGKIPRIGFLFFGSLGPSRELDAFRQGLRELGYAEGQNIAVEYRFARGEIERLPELATELARLKMDVLITPGTAAALAAKRATTTIPIVFAGVADAVGAGLVTNLA